MGRKFNIPTFYRSSVVSTIKGHRRVADTRKKDLSPSELKLGRLTFKIARHFGFCFGVENAIEIAYRAVGENPNKRVFLLSEMIHNPHVNSDLLRRGVKFILSTDGAQLIPFETLTPEDIVIVPAFGTTVELFNKLDSLGINPRLYDATCPFVEKVWKRSEQLGTKGFSVVIHGKHSHEETRATFSHAKLTGPSLVIRDINEAGVLAKYLLGEIPVENFFNDFEGRASPDFDPSTHLNRIGVVNQTTMLATETQEITELLKIAMLKRYGAQDLNFHFADTRDTLCYATAENQDATHGLIASGGDIAVVVGGYNSSNTSHLVELCEKAVPTFYIKDSSEILSPDKIRHLDMHKGEVVESSGWLPLNKDSVSILLTAGASCPDVLVDEVITRIASFFSEETRIGAALQPFESLPTGDCQESSI